MTTAFKVVQDALVALLAQAPVLVAGGVRAGRALPLPEAVASDMAVSLERMQGADISLTGGPVNWDVEFAIEMRVRGSAAVDAVAAADPILEGAYARLAAATPPAGVLGWVLQPSVRLAVEEGDAPVARLALFINVQMRTQPGSLTLAS